jgi:hypothetical protein
MSTYSEPGIFNVLDPWYFDGVAYIGMVANDPGLAEQNALVLQEIISLAQASCDQSHPYGATILFPGHSVVPPPVGSGGTDLGALYYIAVPTGSDTPAAVPIECNWPLRFVGTGSVVLNMVANSDSAWGDMFFIQSAASGDQDVGGITFEDLHLSYGSGATSGAAVHVAAATADGQPNGGQNIRLVRVTLDDCPIGAWFEETLQGSMLECTVVFYENAGTAIQIGNSNNGYESPSGKEIYIAGCVIRINQGTPVGCTGISILGAEHVRVSNTRIEGLSPGIVIQPGTDGANVDRIFFEDVTVYADLVDLDDTEELGQALIIQPAGAGANVGQVLFVGCLFEPVDNPGSTTGGPGIIIDPNGGIIDTVRFVSCYSCRWPGPGLQILGGNNIEVLGGMYAGNALGESPSQPYGIAITGPAANVRVVGVSCVGTYNYITIDRVSASPTQQIGIYVDQGATDVVIDGCDLTKNGTYGAEVTGESESVTTNVLIRDCDISGYSKYYDAVNVNGDVSNVQITDCPGYNDWSPALAISMPTSGATFYNYTYGYYGPVEFYAAPQQGAITEIEVGGTNTQVTQGSFFLRPQESAAITWHTTGMPVPPSFIMIGK